MTVDKLDELDELDSRRRRRVLVAPAKCSEMLSVKVPPALAYRVGVAAASRRLSVGEWIRRALVVELERDGS